MRSLIHHNVHIFLQSSRGNFKQCFTHPNELVWPSYTVFNCIRGCHKWLVDARVLPPDVWFETNLHPGTIPSRIKPDSRMFSSSSPGIKFHHHPTSLCQQTSRSEIVKSNCASNPIILFLREKFQPQFSIPRLSFCCFQPRKWRVILP